jgi:hypothetical protein
MRNDSSEFLLRQVVVYPFYAGDLLLPPLRLKVKRSGGSEHSTEWDVIAMSSPVVLHVREVPCSAGLQAGWPLVGVVTGSLTSGRAFETILDLKGTAHLDMFDLDGWLRHSGYREFIVRTFESEHSVQTLDMQGKRQISVIQRRRWAVRMTAGSKVLDTLKIPIFEPESQSFSDLWLRTNR